LKLPKIQSVLLCCAEGDMLLFIIPCSTTPQHKAMTENADCVCTVRYTFIHRKIKSPSTKHSSTLQF